MPAVPYCCTTDCERSGMHGLHSVGHFRVSAVTFHTVHIILCKGDAATKCTFIVREGGAQGEQTDGSYESSHAASMSSGPDQKCVARRLWCVCILCQGSIHAGRAFAEIYWGKGDEQLKKSEEIHWPRQILGLSKGARTPQLWR